MVRFAPDFKGRFSEEIVTGNQTIVENRYQRGLTLPTPNGIEPNDTESSNDVERV
ncbi:hypothetical protein Pla22_13230 [Rubripirellula amarantea]|uniref:Uncharacterized protein n=1 Tax=Rubripirellula amarantea TaxID=2527999 RepID=A0A5C5WV45_9BACT|nr:hypothetical protein Pla22_13230 [Rubripirellula amarantea]